MMKLSEHSPILYEKDNLTQSVNGDQILAYRVILPEAFSLSEKQFEEIHALWYKALKNLPKCVFVKQDYYVKKQFKASNMPEDTFLQKAAKKHATGKVFTSHVCNIYFINAGSRYLKNGSIANPFKKPPNEKQIQTQTAIDQTFVEEINQAVGFLKSSHHLTVAPLKKGYGTSMAKRYFNGFYNDRITDTVRKGDEFHIGDKRVGTFAITSNRQLPENISTSVVDSKASSGDYQFHRGMFDSFGLELTFDHVYTQIVYLDDHRELKNDIREQQSNFYKARQFAPENEQSSEELTAYLKEISSDERIRLVRAHYNISFFAETPEQYQSYQTQITQRFKDLDITPYFPTGNNQANIYNHSFFTNVSGLNQPNAFVLDLQQALCLFSNVSILPYTFSLNQDSHLASILFLYQKERSQIC